MKREVIASIILSVALATILIFFLRDDILLQPAPLSIEQIAPNIVYNSQPTVVVIEGTGFTPSFNVNLIVGGVSSVIDPSIHNGIFISANEIRLNLPSEIPPLVGEISITDEDGAESNPYSFEIRSGIPPLSPSIVQVSPIGLENALALEILPATVYGNNFDTTSGIVLDGIDLSSRILARTENKIDFYLFRVEIEPANIIEVYNEGNYFSNEFNIDETTVKYPDIIHITPTTAVSGNTITIIGHNFFQSTSYLYVDDIQISPEEYNFVSNSDGTFEISFSANLVGQGIHSVHFDTPPRNPSINYNRDNSNKVYFELKNSLSVPILIENNFIRLQFDGNTGSLSEVFNKETSYSYTLENMYPWRMHLREIVDPLNLSAWINLPIETAFNPYAGDCINDLESQVQQIQNTQILTLRWNNCAIDSGNHFNYVQEYRLENDKDYVEMNFYTENIDVNRYSILVLRNYITFVDTDSIRETGMQSGRGLEVTRDPAYNVKSKGGRNVCSDWTDFPPPEGQPSCGSVGYEIMIPHGWINTDGDGYHLHANSLLDLWIGYWNEDGDYIYAIPFDTYTYGKGYSYVGEQGYYKNTAVALYPDSFNPDNFNHVPAYRYRIGVGKGTEFVGDETWINIADEFRNIQDELGMLNTPLDLRDIPEHVKYLDLTTATGLDAEFFQLSGGQISHNPNPNSEEIAELFESSRKYFGAEESTILIWGGEQDRLDGIKYDPIPGTTLPFLERLNNAGWNPCFYTVNGALQIRVDEPVYPSMADQTVEFDPTGHRTIVGVEGDGIYDLHTFASGYSTNLGENEMSYLKWFLEKYRVFNNNGKGMRCFYSDGIFVNSWYGSGGPWSQLYQQKGWDEKALPSLKEFFRKEFEELREIDPDTYTFHEAVSQFSTDEGLFPVIATPGGIAGENGGSGTQIENAQNVQFYQRVWGGYMDFILSHELADPNMVVLTHIPEYIYPQLFSIPGVNPNYDKTLEETYAMPGIVGFMRKGAIPYYTEPGVRQAADYTPIHNFANAPVGAFFNYWYQPLDSYADINKELVQARQLARNYFHGLWYPGVISDSPLETYYYFSDFSLFVEGKDSGVAEIEVPRVVSTVRQPLGEDGVWDDRYGIMFMNSYFREDEQIVNFNFDFDRYRAVRGQAYNLFKYTKENGREYLGTYSDNFNYALSVPTRKFVLLELEKDGDNDNDGVSGIDDVCPNTQLDVPVNLAGCSVPLTNEFSDTLTSNLDLSPDLFRHQDLSVGIANAGRIEYVNQELRLLRFNIRTQSFDGLDLDDAIQIENNKISVNTEKYPELDQTARLTLYNLPYAQTPIVTIQTANGFVECPQPNCSIVSYSNGQLIFNVVGFSNYSTMASSSTTGGPTGGPTGASGSNSGSSSGSSTSGTTGSPPPTINPQCNDNIDNDNDGDNDYPADAGCLNAQDNIELDADYTQGTGTENPEEIESSSQFNLRVVFWLVLLILIIGISIISIKLVRMFSLNKRFATLSQRSDNLNNAFNTKQDLLTDNNSSY